VLVGLVLVDGWPIAHHVFEGNRRDAKTVPDVLRDLEQRFGLTSRACGYSWFTPKSAWRMSAHSSRNTCYRAASYGLTRAGLSPAGLHQLSLAPSETWANGKSGEREKKGAILLI
jgi:hypothetical protein